ncbi:unnamed protein product, partial [Owenia fusiformis]
DADLGALRLAVLASMKAKKKETVEQEDDDDLAALREAALKSKKEKEKSLSKETNLIGAHNPSPRPSEVSPQSREASPHSREPSPRPRRYAPTGRPGIPIVPPPGEDYRPPPSRSGPGPVLRQENKPHYRQEVTPRHGPPYRQDMAARQPPPYRREVPSRSGFKQELPSRQGPAYRRGVPSRKVPPHRQENTSRPETNFKQDVKPHSPLRSQPATKQPNPVLKQQATSLRDDKAKPALIRPQDKWLEDTVGSSQSPQKTKVKSKFDRFESSSDSDSSSDSSSDSDDNALPVKPDTSESEHSDNDKKAEPEVEGDTNNARDDTLDDSLNIDGVLNLLDNSLNSIFNLDNPVKDLKDSVEVKKDTDVKKDSDSDWSESGRLKSKKSSNDSGALANKTDPQTNIADKEKIKKLKKKRKKKDKKKHKKEIDSLDQDSIKEDPSIIANQSKEASLSSLHDGNEPKALLAKRKRTEWDTSSDDDLNKHTHIKASDKKASDKYNGSKNPNILEDSDSDSESESSRFKQVNKNPSQHIKIGYINNKINLKKGAGFKAIDSSLDNVLQDTNRRGGRRERGGRTRDRVRGGGRQTNVLPNVNVDPEWDARSYAPDGNKIGYAPCSNRKTEQWESESDTEDNATSKLSAVSSVLKRNSQQPHSSGSRDCSPLRPVLRQRGGGGRERGRSLSPSRNIRSRLGPSEGSPHRSPSSNLPDMKDSPSKISIRSRLGIETKSSKISLNKTSDKAGSQEKSAPKITFVSSSESKDKHLSQDKHVVQTDSESDDQSDARTLIQKLKTKNKKHKSRSKSKSRSTSPTIQITFNRDAGNSSSKKSVKSRLGRSIHERLGLPIMKQDSDSLLDNLHKKNKKHIDINLQYNSNNDYSKIEKRDREQGNEETAPKRLKLSNSSRLRKRRTSDDRRSRSPSPPGEELENRIRKIKVKNEAIMRRKLEIDEDRKRYGK